MIIFSLKEQQKKDDEIHEYEKLKEVLEIMKFEYQIERNKKDSLEVRVGIIITFLSTIIAFMFEKINISDLFKLLNKNLDFFLLIKIVSGIIFYVSLILICRYAFKIINIERYDNFKAEIINKKFLKYNKVKILEKFIEMYSKIIVQHRNLNEKKAKNLEKMIFLFLIFLGSIMIHMSIK